MSQPSEDAPGADAPAPAQRILAVDPGQAGVRLDRFLAASLGLSRAQTRRLLERGAVRVAGRAVAGEAKGLALRAGEAVAVADFARPRARRVPAEPDVPLCVLAEGAGWIAVDKPARVPVHPLAEGERGTLLGALVARRPQLQGLGEGGLRSAVVHRLDVETSGAMLFATDQAGWLRLRAAFAAHRVEKVYRAIVRGRMQGGGRVELPLVVGRHRPARVRPARAGERGFATALEWRALEPLAGATLVEVRPTTGFLHQIRASFAHLGHPLAGDRRYAPEGDASGAPRLMLHAARVAFEEIAAESPDPDDFAARLRELRRA